MELNAQYVVALVLVVVGLGVALHFHLSAKRKREAEEAKRRSFEREARLLERRKKPRGPR